MLLIACAALLMAGAKALSTRYAQWKVNRHLVQELEFHLTLCDGERDRLPPFFAARTIDGGRAMVPMLLKHLLANNEPFSCRFLGELGSDAEPAVPELIRALRRDGNVSDICDVLGAIGPKAGNAVPFLVECLAADAAYLRASAVRALGRIGVRSDLVRRAVAARLYDQDVDVRLQAARAALSLGMDAEPSVRTLVAVLEKVDGEHANQYRDEALEALGEIGKPADSALPVIQKFLKHEPSQDWALLALLRIRGPGDGVLQTLLRNLREQPLHVIRPIMAKTLLKESDESRDVVVEAFRQLLDMQNGQRILDQQLVFRSSICHLGRPGIPLIPLVRGYLKDCDPLARQLACVALTSFGKGSGDLVTQLEEMATNDESLYVRLQADDAATRLRETVLH